MADQKGSLRYILVNINPSGDPNWNRLKCSDSTGLGLNPTEVDTTTNCDALANGTVWESSQIVSQHVSFDVGGVVATADPAGAFIRSQFFAGENELDMIYQTDADSNAYRGTFRQQGYTEDASATDVVRFSVSFKSSGPVTIAVPVTPV